MTLFFQSMMALLTFTISAALITGTAYAENSTAPAMSTGESDVLFQSFGGSAGIGKVVDDLLDIWHGDSRIRVKLEGADVEHLRMRLKEQFTQVTGGSGEYKGKDMKTIHDGLDLRNTDFNALVEDLQLAMDKNNIPSRVQNKLLAKLAPMHRDIVTK